MSDADPRGLESMVAAGERGYMGRVRRVRTEHIRQLIWDANQLAGFVDGQVFPEPPPGGEVEGAEQTLRSMERAVNLLQHAAAELEDERLRLRDGWPQ